MTSFIEKRAAARRMKRGSSPDVERGEQLPVRVNGKLHALWKLAATRAGESLTKWIEKGLNAAVRRRKGG